LFPGRPRTAFRLNGGKWETRKRPSLTAVGRKAVEDYRRPRRSATFDATGKFRQGLEESIPAHNGQTPALAEAGRSGSIRAGLGNGRSAGDGSALVRSQPSALDLFASLKPSKSFPGSNEEKEAMHRLIGELAAKEGRRE